MSFQAVGGTIWHGVKGFRNSPYGERRLGAITSIKMRAPVLGGNFGVWGGLFSTFDCAVKGVRKKEDAYVYPTLSPQFRVATGLFEPAVAREFHGNRNKLTRR